MAFVVYILLLCIFNTMVVVVVGISSSVHAFLPRSLGHQCICIKFMRHWRLQNFYQQWRQKVSFPVFRSIAISVARSFSLPLPPSSIYLFLLYLKLKTTSNIRQNNAGSVKTNQCARQILIEVGQIFKLHDTNCASTALVLRILAMVICIFVGFKWQWCWCYAIMYADKRRMFFGFKWLLVSVLLNGVASLIVKFTLKLINLKCDLFRSFSSLKIKHS